MNSTRRSARCRTSTSRDCTTYPDDDHEPLPAEVTRLRILIGTADALLIYVPGYTGELPGSFRNLLDWTVGGAEISDKQSAWINVSTAPPTAARSHAALRTVLGYTGPALSTLPAPTFPPLARLTDPATNLIADPPCAQPHHARPHPSHQPLTRFTVRAVQSGQGHYPRVHTASERSRRRSGAGSCAKDSFSPRRKAEVAEGHRNTDDVLLRSVPPQYSEVRRGEVRVLPVQQHCRCGALQWRKHLGALPEQRQRGRLCPRCSGFSFAVCECCDIFREAQCGGHLKRGVLPVPCRRGDRQRSLAPC
ncbi:NADPH-dependent FMN reductase [Actinacidiphila sp. DG2A-62]|uniref:NADPH-dependent FMN reductase n=1 Tax=Actinacidiphila sp. DG2A-62 TaxID=3108821 RepID=UPI003FA35BC0